MSGRDLFLGIDLGTTSVKAALVDAYGTPIGQCATEYPLYQPKPGWAEQSPLDWWDATAKTVFRLTRQFGVAENQIRGISVSSQAPTCLGVDAGGAPTGHALIWMDQRAKGICENELSGLENEIRSTCGNRVDPYYFLPKLLWIKKNHPEQDRSTWKYLQANGWIIFCMTGKTSLDVTHLTHMQIYDVFQNCWNEDLIRRLGLRHDQFPSVCSCSDPVGTLLPQAAARLGLSPGIPVAAGCTDAAAVSLGLNHNKPGCLFEMSGQSSGIGLITDRPLKSPVLNLSRGVLSGRWCQKGSMSSTGGSLRWFRDQIDGRAGDAGAYTQYDDLAALSAPGSNGVVFLPYLSGERAPLWDSHACGLFFGLRCETTKGDMIRAILEGAAFGLRTILDCFEPSLLTQRFLYGAGGGYRSALWAQVKADVLELPIYVQRQTCDAACIGDAYLAMRMTGFPVPEPAEGEVEAIYTPDSSVAGRYQQRYEQYQALYRQTKELMARNSKFLTALDRANN